MSVQGQPKKTLKEIIADEYKKCAVDPIYFMKKYCVIQHPTRGKIPFHLYPFQENCLDDFKDNLLAGDIIDWSGRVSNVRKSSFQFNSNSQKLI